MECDHGDVILSNDFPKILLNGWLSSKVHYTYVHVYTCTSIFILMHARFAHIVAMVYQTYAGTEFLQYQSAPVEIITQQK